jgi:hypothetical protein
MYLFSNHHSSFYVIVPTGSSLDTCLAESFERWPPLKQTGQRQKGKKRMIANLQSLDPDIVGHLEEAHKLAQRL